jgi:hypothetical protein
MEKPLQCLKHSMVGRVELGFGSLIFQCSMFRSALLGVNARALGELQKRLELTITTSSRSHSHAWSLSQFSIPSLAVALVHVLVFFPNRKCSMSSAFFSLLRRDLTSDSSRKLPTVAASHGTRLACLNFSRKQ